MKTHSLAAFIYVKNIHLFESRCLTVLFPRSITLQDSSTDFPFIAVIVRRIVLMSNLGPLFSCFSSLDIE